MAEEPEDFDEEEEGPEQERTTVLWERHIEQSIFVDLSEDESLHLSDLESSLALHLSKAESASSEASIHLSELSPLDDSSSDSSVKVRGQSRRSAQGKSSVPHVSAQRSITMPEEEEAGQNTSDEDQEDLPFDEELGSLYFNQAECSEDNTSSDGGRTLHSSPDVLEFTRREHEAPVVDERSGSRPPGEQQPDVKQLLLRHFSEEELLLKGRLIEAETLPEVSLLESVDETLLSQMIDNNRSMRRSKSGGSASQNSSFEEETLKNIESIASVSDSAPEGPQKNIESIASVSDSAPESCVIDGEKQEASEEVERQSPKDPLMRARSFSEIKYGQGQVHYPLPDFSKVAPKVKIPKGTGAPVKPLPPGPSMHRVQSSPGMLEVISRVLEDSVQLPQRPREPPKEPDQESGPALVHHLQAEYDKLLIKYAEAENLIDKMRLGTNPCTEDMLFLEHDVSLEENRGEESHLGNAAPLRAPLVTMFPENVREKVAAKKEAGLTSSAWPDPEAPSDGEKMTAELRDIISQFRETVEEFKGNVSNTAVITAEQQTMLRSMIEAQDQLERKYMSRKEEHRALEMQNYMGLARNTGTFDPDRLLEGDIFRVGMHLEDIKEMIDRNLCEQISPPSFSSTSNATLVTVSPLSPPPLSMHQEPSVCASFAVEAQSEERTQEGANVKFEAIGERSNFISEETLVKNTMHGSCSSRYSASGCSTSTLGCVKGGGVPAAEGQDIGNEEKRSVFSDGTISRSISADFVTGGSLSSVGAERQWTPLSCRGITQEASERDPADCVSPTVEVSLSSDTHRPSCRPPLNSSSPSHRIVSPETDSGFGSSYLNQSASGTLEPNLHAQRVPNDTLSSSDSDGSCSNLQTAIHSADLTTQQWPVHHSSQSRDTAAAVELWLQSSTKESSLKRQGSHHSEPTLHHHVSEPILSTAMDAAQRDGHLCSCNSEAIQALQSEVSRLKKDLEEGLVQLPHLSQRMEYLISQYRQDRPEHRSKPRPRTHRRAASDSLWTTTNSRQNVSNLSSSQVRIEDWISTDMDHSKSKGSGGGDSGSEVKTQFSDSPAGSRRGSGSAFHAVLQDSRGSVKTLDLTSFSLKRGRDINAKQRSHKAIESFSTKDRWSLLSPPSPQRPLLQVSYGSSSSLPASYKVWETPLETTSNHRKRSTHSDSALLPSNVYFMQTQSLGLKPSKANSRTEEEMTRTLDQAIEVARTMMRTTDYMAKSLSADLAKAQLRRKQHKIQPQGGRKHHVLKHSPPGSLHSKQPF